LKYNLSNINLLWTIFNDSLYILNCDTEMSDDVIVWHENDEIELNILISAGIGLPFQLTHVYEK